MARKPWKYYVIIKVVGKKIGYHYLYIKLQAMWKLPSSFMLIDLANDFFIVKLSNKQEQDMAIIHGPWMIADHYIHVRKWIPNFEPEIAEVTTLPIWIRFPVLPVEYYNEQWLQRAGDKLSKKLKVDRTTLVASRGRFARNCVEVDLRKPLCAGYWLRGRRRKLQYEGLHLLCFQCGVYGHQGLNCPTPQGNQNVNAERQSSSAPPQPPLPSEAEETGNQYGPWMIARRNRRRPASYIAAEGDQRPTRGSRFNVLGNCAKNHVETRGSLAIIPVNTQKRRAPMMDGTAASARDSKHEGDDLNADNVRDIQKDADLGDYRSPGSSARRLQSMTSHKEMEIECEAVMGIH